MRGGLRGVGRGKKRQEYSKYIAYVYQIIKKK